jgi:hypothetical protein
MIGKILAAAIAAASLAHAQHDHFPAMKWKEKSTDHFTLRVDSTSGDPATKYAEKVWEVVLPVLPAMKDDFAKNDFRTPAGEEGSDEKPFRFTVYLLGKGSDYDEVVQTDASRNGWDANFIKLVKRTGSYADPQHRYVVLCKGATDQSAGGDRDMTPVFVHSTGSTLMEGQARGKNLPFWMTAGFGYYVEHMLFKLCRVHYLDFEAYYKDQDADVKKGETLGPDQSWAKIIRKMCKKDDRVSLDQVCGAQVISLTPQQSGYIFALTYFLVRDEPARVKYRSLVAQSADGGTIDKAALLKAYGYADDAALEAEWYEWLEKGKEFK